MYTIFRTMHVGLLKVSVLFLFALFALSQGDKGPRGRGVEEFLLYIIINTYNFIWHNTFNIQLRDTYYL